MNQKISDREIAAISLLHRWMTNKPNDWKPGAWDYDAEGAQLVNDTAQLLEIEDPWKDQ